MKESRLNEKRSGRGRMNDNQLLTIKELSEWLNVSESTLRKWYSRGEIPHYNIRRHIRFDRHKILKFLAKNEIKAGRRVEL
jgi:excisionase family DNA binding protein